MHCKNTRAACVLAFRRLFELFRQSIFRVPVDCGGNNRTIKNNLVALELRAEVVLIVDDGGSCMYAHGIIYRYIAEGYH